MKKYLLIPKLKIHNANAMSSAYTVGFPAMTAWLGAMHALERNIRSNGYAIRLSALGVSSHACHVQLYSEAKTGKKLLIGTANPLKKSKKTGEFERPPFIEEARCNLLVSLLMEIKGFNPDEEKEFLSCTATELSRMKIAGGDIENDILHRHGSNQIKIITVDFADEKDIARLKRSLMPGYVLRERCDLLAGADDSLDELLENLAVCCTLERDDKGKVVGRQYKKVKNNGWIVPIMTGYRDLTGACRVANQRSYDYEHHFVEPLVTVGEFVMPHTCQTVEEFMWHYDYDKENGIYCCTTRNV